MTDPSAPVPGAPSHIGKYQIVSVVGEGAMGTVYRAIDSVIGRTVAIKVMNPEVARDKGHRERFLREAQSAGSLQHPNVVTIYDLGEVDGHLFIAMEFLHGADLEKLMASPEPLKLQAKLDIIVDVLMGLSYAHKNGIVHRDIKPANIRVSDDGKAKIMDFGVAHLASSDMTKTGIAVGTPSYMAPEQITGGKMVPGTDIFAVGAVMYHLLSGSKPFEAPTLQSLFYRIVTDMPRPMDQVRAGLPPALDRIVRKAMAKDPEQRYATALDMANEIISVRAELSGNPYATTASLTGLTKVGEVGDTIEITGGSHRSWKPVAIGVGAAVLVIAGWLLISPSTDAPPSTVVAADTPLVAVSSPAAEVPAPPASDPETQKAVADPDSVLVKAAEPPPPPPPPPAPPAAAKKTQAPRRAAVVPPRRVVPPPAPREQQRPAPSVITPPPPPPAPPPAPPPVIVAPPPAASVERPVERPAPPTRSARDDIAAVVAAYARAIESRDIGAVRRAYPGISADQAQGFQEFFRSTRSINVTFSVTGLDTSGSSADARLVGTYEYTSTDGRTHRQPVSFTALFRNDGSDWQLRSVR